MIAIELKEKIRRRELVVGFQQFSASPTITEIAGRAGFDFVMLCTEHGSAGFGTDLENLIRAADAVGIVPIVRVPDNQRYFTAKAIELGAKGVIVPRVKNEQDVTAAVQHTKYPYFGDRGFCPYNRAFMYNPQPGFMDRADEETLCIPILEEKEAFEHLEGILSVQGIDATVFGPGDLGVSLGLREKIQNLNLASLLDLKRNILEPYRRQWMALSKEKNMPMIEIPSDIEDAKRLIDEGIRIILSTLDEAWLFNVFSNYVESIRKLKKVA